MKAIIILLKYIYLMFQVYKGTEYFRNIMENREKITLIIFVGRIIFQKVISPVLSKKRPLFFRGEVFLNPADYILYYSGMIDIKQFTEEIFSVNK